MSQLKLITIPYNQQDLNPFLVKNLDTFFKKHPDILKAICSWVLLANRSFLDEIRTLNVFMQKMRFINTSEYLYRGMEFNIAKGGFGEKLGIKNPHLHEVYNFSTKEKVVSFTTDVRIARSFGNVIVKAAFPQDKSQYLVLCKEIMFLISKESKLDKLETQEEVILIPPFSLDFEIAEINRKPIWSIW